MFITSVGVARVLPLLLFLALASTGCGESPDEGDAGLVDAGRGLDAGSRDAGPSDSGSDAGRSDAGMTDAGTDAALDGGSDAGSPAGRPLGTVVDDGSCARDVEEGSCERVLVQCPDTNDLAAELRIRMATTTPAHGWVLLASSQRGADWFDNIGGGDAFIDDLRDAGYHVVERAWDGNGWFETTAAESTLPTQACRLATLIDHVARSYATDLPLCAHGHSGGSMELATAAAFYPVDDDLTYFSVSGGPYHDLFEVCAPGDASGWFPGRCETLLTGNLGCSGLDSRACDTDKQDDLNNAFGTSRNPCVGRGGSGTTSAADQALLEASSLLGPDAKRRFESTVGLTLGVGECSGLGAGGLAWRDAIEAAGTTVVLPPTGSIGPMVRHNVFQTMDGSYVAGPIVSLFEAHCQ